MVVRRGVGVRAGDAKAVARDWVFAEASKLPGFCGAYFIGSINSCADDAVLPPSSDLDLALVFEAESQVRERAKFLRRGVLIEATRFAVDQLGSPERILRDYRLAGAFRPQSIILDQTGHLTAREAAVSRDFAKRYWVLQRCEDVRRRILDMRDRLPQAPGLYEQVVGWLFPTGQTTHMLLVAGLRNPTVRKRYVAVRELLIEYGQFELYEELLELLGCARMDRARVESHPCAAGVWVRSCERLAVGAAEADPSSLHRLNASSADMLVGGNSRGRPIGARSTCALHGRGSIDQSSDATGVRSGTAVCSQ